MQARLWQQAALIPSAIVPVLFAVAVEAVRRLRKGGGRRYHRRRDAEVNRAGIVTTGRDEQTSM